MFSKRVNHFKVTTKWPELINRRILQIDNQLQDIQFINQVQFLYARGLIKREIIYMEPDGRFRKMEDKVQFEINLGQAVLEPLPYFSVELQQDYYLFFPEKIGEKQALFEQSFTLMFQEDKSNLIEESSELLLINTIVSSGTGCDYLRILINFPNELSKPKEFQGIIHFAKNIVPPVADGIVEGIITYRSYNNLIAEIDIKQQLSFLINAPIPDRDQFIFISGDIKDINWKPTSTAADWWLEIQINYQWFICEPKEIYCIVDKNGCLESEQIKTYFLIKKNCYEFPQVVSYLIDETASNIVIEITAVSNHLKPLKKGLLLTIKLKCEVIFTNEAGIEKYREFYSQIDELVEKSSSNNFDEQEFFKTTVEVCPIKYDFFNGELKISLNCYYYINTYLVKLFSVVIDDNSVESVVVPVLAGQESFFISGEEVFKLPCTFTQIIEVKAGFIQCKPVTQKGILNINGDFEVGVSYTDLKGKLRDNKFTLFFQEGFFWERLESFNEVTLKSKLEYDSIIIEGDIIKYKYLISFFAESYQEKVIKIASLKRNEPVPDSQSLGKPIIKDRIIESITIESDLLLKQGNICEIIGSKAGIVEFEIRDSLRALFVKGNFTGEIEYWDKERYLQRECIELPFWKFVDNPIRSVECSRIIPEIIHYSFSPVKNRLWRKDRLQINFEIELKYEGDS